MKARTEQGGEDGRKERDRQTEGGREKKKYTDILAGRSDVLKLQGCSGWFRGGKFCLQTVLRVT